MTLALAPILCGSVITACSSSTNYPPLIGGPFEAGGGGGGPHGGGEGKSKGGRHPVTPWGVPTLGKRTRRKHKESDKLIVRARRRGKEGRR